MDEALDARLRNITGQMLRDLVHEKGVFRKKGKMPSAEAFDHAATSLRGAVRFRASRSTREEQRDYLRQRADAVRFFLKECDPPSSDPDEEPWPDHPDRQMWKRELKAAERDLLLDSLGDPPLGQPKYRNEWREIAWDLSAVFDRLVGQETFGISVEGPRVRFILAVIPWVTEEDPTDKTLNAANVANHLKETKNVKR